MLIRDKMVTDVITVNLSDPIEKAEKLMMKHNINHLPVIGGNKLVGMLAMFDVRHVLPSPVSMMSEEEKAEFAGKVTVKDAIPEKQRLTTIMEHESIEQAAMLLYNNKIGALPVVDANFKLLGIISETDILNAFVDILWIKGRRITVKMGPEPGLIADVAKVISSFDVAILRIAMLPTADAGNFETLISLDTENTKPIVEELRRKGYEVVES